MQLGEYVAPACAGVTTECWGVATVVVIPPSNAVIPAAAGIHRWPLAPPLPRRTGFAGGDSHEQGQRSDKEGSPKDRRQSARSEESLPSAFCLLPSAFRLLTPES